MPDQNRDSATTMKTPLPGTPGGKMVGYAEAERLANPDPGPSETISEAGFFEQELEKVTGKSIGNITEEDFYRVPINFVAQNTMYSTELSVIMKDPAMTCRWFNKNHRDGAMVQQALYRGYQPCTKEDVELCHATASDVNGALVMGDLVLLKMSKVRHFSALKKNAETAKYNVSQQMSKPFSVKVPGTDNGELSNSAASFYELDNSTATKMVDASEARSLVFNK
jgi:hypothetical protein